MTQVQTQNSTISRGKEIEKGTEQMYFERLKRKPTHYPDGRGHRVQGILGAECRRRDYASEQSLCTRSALALPSLYPRTCIVFTKR